MTIDEKIAEIETIFKDYEEVLTKDQEVKDNMAYLLGRYAFTGEDVTENELDTLKAFLKQKVEEFVKTKGN